MSPEQVQGREVDGRSDLFALGIVLYEALTGGAPFPGPDLTTILQRIVHADPLPARELNREIPPALEAVIWRALAKEPRHRYPDGRAMADALTQAAQTPGRKPPAEKSSPDSPQGRLRSGDRQTIPEPRAAAVCSSCHESEVAAAGVSVMTRVGETPCVVTEVPADLCLRCGQYTLHPSVARRVQDLLSEEGPRRTTADGGIKIVYRE
jgi:serine/threonine protein kinase